MVTVRERVRILTPEFQLHTRTGQGYNSASEAKARVGRPRPSSVPVIFLPGTPLGEKVCGPQIGSGLRTRLRCRLARTAAALASSRRGRSAIVRTGGRLATSISTHATRSASAGGCRKSGWLTAASRRLPDRRVQNVWSVTVYVRSVLITSTVDPSKRYTRSYLAGGLARSSVPTNRKSRAARRARWGARTVKRAHGGFGSPP